MLQQSYLTEFDPALLHEPGVLTVVSFAPQCVPPDQLGIIPVGFGALSEHAAECLRYGSTPAIRGVQDGCHWSCIDDVICVATWISPQDCEAIDQATCEAYIRIARVLKAHDKTHMFRAWNFIPAINEGEGDYENYKKFCAGRLRAFLEIGLTEQGFPAASALGHHSEGAVIYVLASSRAPLQFENPQQQSAYHYPREYGPSSPSFARASVIDLQRQRVLFISGTASILGHETHAVGDLQRQLAVTHDNIASLVERVSPGQRALDVVRIYLREQQDFAHAEAFARQAFPGAHCSVVHADICRANLLVEIEAAVAIPAGN